MKTGIYPYDVVEVIWDDAAGENGWESPDKDLEDQLVITIGFLVKQTRNHVLIAQSADKANINGTIQIPKGMIKSVKRLHSKMSLEP